MFTWQFMMLDYMRHIWILPLSTCSRSISTPCSDTKHDYDFLYNHRICVNSTHITLSCSDCNRIYVLDLNGKLKHSLCPDISFIMPSSPECKDEHSTKDGKLSWPHICQEDDDGAILVADRFNDRMLVLTAEGHWRRVRLSDKLKSPVGAVWMKGRLYVTNDRKLTMFK